MHRVEERHLGFHHGSMGEALLKEWNIPDFIRTMVGGHHSPDESDLPRESAVVHLADAMALALRWGNSGSHLVPTLSQRGLDMLEIPPEALFQTLNAPEIGMELTDGLAMFPASSVSGFYLAHPQATYFVVGQIGEDQLQDMAQRRGMDEAELRRRLAPNL